ncbi:MAG: ATP-binding cassette domain-containing protein [Alphaproteobacteria bacterium]|mgnify:CR=1 FL=1
MIEVEGLEKSFKAVHALRGVSFSAYDGEITGLIGPNGAGKTTTLRILYTVLRPGRGSAKVDGFDSRLEPREVQRRIGVLADSRGLYPRLTAREHVRYFGRLHGLAGASLEARIDALVSMLDMDDIADRRTKGFSKGQTMKVALARALVHNPHNVLLDEPTNGLDVGAARAVRNLIRRIREEGRCVLYIMSEVEQLCDRLVVVGHGVVLANGTAAELRARTGQQDLEEAFIQMTAAPPEMETP